MDTLNKLREKNPHLNILPVRDPAFGRYGQIHHGLDTERLVKNVLDYVKMPDRVVAYEASIPELEDEKTVTELQNKVYGEMPIEIGLCYGWNTKLNGLEYHKGNELTVAVTDLVLLLGDYRDIRFGEQITYDTSLVEAFYVEAGTVFELYESCLHYAAVHVHDEKGFIAVIVLPRGTNEPLKHPVEKKAENRLLWAVNKWLMVHPEAANGEYVGLVGDNITVNTL